MIVRRRMNTISGHFAAGIVTDDVAAATTHLFPLNCSSNLSTPFRRFDSRTDFARQGSSTQGYFMRQAVTSIQQDNTVHRPRVCSTDANPPLFSRPATGEPLFSKPAEMEFNCSNSAIIEPFTTQKNIMSSAPECPKFARPGEENRFGSKRHMLSSQINEWMPSINVVESKSSYVITVELPGVDIKDIRVEMDDKNIIVKGKRLMKWWKAGGCSNDSLTTYHKREISQGPCQVVCPLPAAANKDAVFAEFVEGILHITIPKL